MKRRPEEGVTWRQLELMRRWQASIMVVARQEMEHLGLVCNLLTAIGEAPWLVRPDLPLRRRHYHLDVGERFERLGEDALRRFVLFEIPDALTGAERERLAAAFGEDLDPERHQTIGRLYDEIERLIELLGDPLFIGPPGAQLATTSVIPVSGSLRGIALPPNATLYDIRLDPVTSAATAIAVVRRIKEEGEGSPHSTPESHFTRFLDVLEELRAERERAPDFDPSRPVTAHPDPREIRDPRTRRASEFFDQAYATLMLLLMRFFAHTDESASELSGLQRAAFFPMMTTVIRPLAELLTQLPTGSHPPGSTAGPAFRFTRNIALIPHRHAAWQVIQDELDGLAATAEALAEDAGYPADVRARLGLMHENLGRIALDFGLAMGTEVAP
jgi:hypothetical protein